MRYYRVANGHETEISYLEALKSVTGRFVGCQIVRDMLNIPNRIPAIASYILVKDEKYPEMVPMAGLSCLVPDGYEYDEFGGRL